MSTSDRAQAYGRVIKTISDLAPGKLHDSEQQIVREAADAFLFTDTVNDEMRDALIELEELGERLVAADRLSPEAVEVLVRDVEACGPGVPV